jgi:predicted ATPase
MKIDLHCHTKKIKSGEDESRNVTTELFCEKLKDADVKIVAITNHNSFDLEQYNIFSDAVNSFCQIWPGVELDVKGLSGKKWHLIVVANPDNAIYFGAAVERLFVGKDLETCTLELHEIYVSLNCFDVIYITHFHKKPAISEDDRQELLTLVKDNSRVFNETPDNRSLGVFANHNFSVIIGSDVRDWSVYEQSTFAELRLAVSSFAQFCLLSKRDNLVISTLLNDKKSYILLASPHKSVSLSLKIFEEINIIFGQKGTGKSEILGSLYEALLAQGVNCVKYCGSEKDDGFKLLLKTSDLNRDVAKVGAITCEHEFEKLSKWNDCNPTLLSNYVSWYKTKDNNANKSRMKITDSVSEAEPSRLLYLATKKDFSSCISSIKAISNIDAEKYIPHEKAEQLKELLELLCRSIQAKLIDSFIQIYSIRLTNFSINKIKAIADRNSDTVSRPSSTGFFEFAFNRMALKQCLTTIISNITGKEFCEQLQIGELEDKGAIYVNSRYRMLSEQSKTDEFTGGIKVLRDIRQDLKEISGAFFESDIALKVNEIARKCKDYSVCTSADFLGISKQIVTSDGFEYSPSNGEKGILLLQQILQADADAYFLDEPELGMGNSYIDASIRPRLSAIAKQRKVVVVATHNANIAVRTLPYTSVFRVHKNGLYLTYVGNPFNDVLVNINNPIFRNSI